MRLNRHSNRHVSRGTVMLWPVELHAAGDPWAGKPDQRGFNYVLAVEELVAVGFIESEVDSPTDLGQDHQAQILVLDMDSLPRTWYSMLRHAFDARQRVDTPAASLVHAVFQKHG